MGRNEGACQEYSDKVTLPYKESGWILVRMKNYKRNHAHRAGAGDMTGGQRD
jgi:hypothetical protein